MPSVADIFREVPAHLPRERSKPVRKQSAPVYEQPAVESDGYEGVVVQLPTAAPHMGDPVPAAVRAIFTERHGRRRGVLSDRQAVLADLLVELAHEQPDPTKAGLAKALKELVSAEKNGVPVMRRDALMRLAAWAIAAATVVQRGLSNVPREEG